MPKQAKPTSRSPLAALALALPLCSGMWLGLGPASEAAAAPPPMGGGGGGAGPEEEACAGRSIGDACTLPNRQLGTCGQGTCNRLDYSQGSPPKAVEEACVVCQSGGAAPSEDGATNEDGAKREDTGAGGSASNAGPSSKPSDKEPPESSSRCRVDPKGGSPVGLAVLVLLAWVRRGRRRDTAA
jgi:MYXO-CTERM domain-containing protein